MNTKSLSIILFLLTAQVSFGQEYSWNWSVGINSPLNSTANFMEVDQNGNSYLLAKLDGDYRKTNRTPPNTVDMVDEHWVLTKFNPSGEEVWQKNLNAYTQMELKGLKVDFEGNCFIIGLYRVPYIYFLGKRLENLNPVDNVNDGFIAKISAEGQLAWVSSTARRLDETIDYLNLDGMGNAYLITEGEIIEEQAETKPNKLTFVKRKIRALAVIKYGPNGKRIWHSNVQERPPSTLDLISTQDLQNIIDVSEIPQSVLDSISPEDLQILINVEKLPPRTVRLINVKVDFEGNLYIGGFYNGDLNKNLSFFDDIKMRNILPSNSPYFLMKMGPEGEIKWVDQFPHYDLEVDELGNIYFFTLLPPDYWDIGQVTIETFIGKELVLVKYNSDGEYEQHSTFGNQGLLKLWALIKTSEDWNEILAAYEELRQWEYEAFEIGLDGNLYVLAKLKRQSTLEEDQATNQGIFILSFNPDCELLGFADRINDDFRNDDQNPFLEGNELQFLKIDADGNAFLAGKQKSQNLNLGGWKLVNPFQATGVPSIFLAKLQMF